MSLPSFDTDDTIEIVKKGAKKETNRHIRSSSSTTYNCDYIDPKTKKRCEFTTTGKGAYTNHKKSHIPKLKSVVKDNNMLRLQIPITAQQWDSKLEMWVEGFNVPEDYEFHSIVKSVGNNTKVHPVTEQHMSTITILVERIKK